MELVIGNKYFTAGHLNNKTDLVIMYYLLLCVREVILIIVYFYISGDSKLDPSLEENAQQCIEQLHKVFYYVSILSLKLHVIL